MMRKLPVMFVALVLLVGMATAAQAALFDLSTLNATYNATDSHNGNWISTLVSGGTVTYTSGTNGADYYTITQTDWDYNGGIKTFYLGSTNDALYMSKNLNDVGYILFETGTGVGTTWTYTDNSGTWTAQILSTTWGYTDPSNIYYQNAYVVGKESGSSYTGNPSLYEVWLPGTGLLGDVDFGADNPPEMHELAGYMVDNPVPLPPSLLLLASGLACLAGAGWRQRSRR